jgi:uncharacterized protein (DUF58 family)
VELFDSRFLQKLEYLSLVSRRAFRGQLLAHRRTKQVGSGIEFADHRDYVAGDDYRYLDWNVFARHGQLLLKRFQEEADLHVYLLLDCSRSMACGTPPKFDYARQITAALAYIALADLDRVSVIAFAHELLATYPLTRGKQRIVSLLRFLNELRPVGHDTDLQRVSDAFVHRAARTGLTIVISDFFDPRGFQDGVDRLRYHRHEPHLVQLYDQDEANPQLRGELELIDVESERRRAVTVSERSLRQYRRLFVDFLESVRGYARQQGLACVQTTTDLPFDELILRMMRVSGSVA